MGNDESTRNVSTGGSNLPFHPPQGSVCRSGCGDTSTSPARSACTLTAERAEPLRDSRTDKPHTMTHAAVPAQPGCAPSPARSPVPSALPWVGGDTPRPRVPNKAAGESWRQPQLQAAPHPATGSGSAPGSRRQAAASSALGAPGHPPDTRTPGLARAAEPPGPSLHPRTAVAGEHSPGAGQSPGDAHHKQHP